MGEEIADDWPERPPDDLTDGMDEYEHDAADRQGLNRVTLGRSSSGRCHHCSRTFETLAGAISHGRAVGHLVEGEYRARYLYAPTDNGAA